MLLVFWIYLAAEFISHNLVTKTTQILPKFFLTKYRFLNWTEYLQLTFTS